MIADPTGEYFKNNPDFETFIEKVSENTGNVFEKRWIDHVNANYELFKDKGWACPKLQDAEIDKAAVIIGSSPALAKQVDTLRDLVYDPQFVLCGLSSNLEYLLNNGIIPKYCIVVDADESTGRDWDRIDMDRTKNITLIAATVCYPPMLKKWKGPLYFLGLVTNDQRIRKVHHEKYKNLNGSGMDFPTLMGQFNIMTAFAFMTLHSSVLIFVGNELSFKADDSTYYVDRKDPRDNDRAGVQGDIYGNLVFTNTNLMALKLSLEMFLEMIAGAGWFFNCTEAGIFGVTKRYPDQRVPWIHQLTLTAGIMQARSILRTGKPFTYGSSGTRILVPELGGIYNE